MQSSEVAEAARRRDRRTGVLLRHTWAMAMAISVLPVPISAMMATELACWSLFAAPAIATSWAANGFRRSVPKIGETGSPGACKSGKARQNAVSDFDRELSQVLFECCDCHRSDSNRMEVDPRHCRAGLRWRDLDLAVLEAGPDPFKKLILCALDCHGGTIQAGQWPDTASSSGGERRTTRSNRIAGAGRGG